MKIEDLKQSVLREQLFGHPILIKYKDTDFIILQYIQYLKTRGFEVQYIENFDCISSTNIFEVATSEKQLYVLRTDSLEEKIPFNVNKNVFIICKKYKFEDAAESNVIELPELELWQIKDFAYSMTDGAEESDIDYIFNLCGNDIFRLNNELEKIHLFELPERKSLVKDFIQDNVFSDLSKYTVFDFTSAIVKHDLNTLRTIYRDIDVIDCEPLGLVTILLNNFKDVISVQLSVNPSPEKCGMQTKKFWAVKYSCGFYNKQQLISIYKMLTEIDTKVKLGEIPVTYIVDYIVTFIFNL